MNESALNSFRVPNISVPYTICISECILYI